jgi:hypothetical protein
MCYSPAPETAASMTMSQSDQLLICIPVFLPLIFPGGMIFGASALPGTVLKLYLTDGQSKRVILQPFTVLYHDKSERLNFE